MARQKQIIADLKERGLDTSEAERTLAQLSAHLPVIENQWLAILKAGTIDNNGPEAPNALANPISRRMRSAL